VTRGRCSGGGENRQGRCAVVVIVVVSLILGSFRVAVCTIHGFFVSDGSMSRLFHVVFLKGCFRLGQASIMVYLRTAVNAWGGIKFA
jgi:hypothetical protein